MTFCHPQPAHVSPGHARSVCDPRTSWFPLLVLPCVVCVGARALWCCLSCVGLIFAFYLVSWVWFWFIFSSFESFLKISLFGDIEHLSGSSHSYK